MEQQDKPVYLKEQKDKRRTLRVPLIVEKLPCRDGRRTFFGYAGNISRGGLFIATVSPREPGEQFELQVTLPPPAELTLQCRCEVVWKRHFARQGKYAPGMGLRFLDLPAEQAAALERWIEASAGRAR
ncbi:MAG: TIGR02266 family protein [Deltaproteobacteria bacterium]|nr:MAG: TIGR02266 family protein [Deltaproteobacteria bacterium]